MIERGRGARLALEPFYSLRVGRELRRQELQRDSSSEADVFGLIDHSHSPAAQKLEDAVVRDRLTDHFRWTAL